jgi:hypothetical protein
MLNLTNQNAVVDNNYTNKVRSRAKRITALNELEHLFALREYYRLNSINGDSDQSFLVWAEVVLKDEQDDLSEGKNSFNKLFGETT